MKTCGIIEEDIAGGVKKIAEPAGVLCGIVPTTNPTSTAIFKASSHQSRDASSPAGWEHLDGGGREGRSELQAVIERWEQRSRKGLHVAALTTAATHD